jgi:hypothetical protein
VEKPWTLLVAGPAENPAAALGELDDR